MREFLDALPDVLAARDFANWPAAIATARIAPAGRLLLMMGAHPIKSDSAPIICGADSRRHH